MEISSLSFVLFVGWLVLSPPFTTTTTTITHRDSLSFLVPCPGHACQKATEEGMIKYCILSW